MRFSEMLTSRRVELHLTKKEVAKLMGFSPMYYARFENGKLMPTKINAKIFSDFLGLSKDELLAILEDEKGVV